MPITLQLNGLQADRIAFGYSGAQNTMNSLHILLDYKHHPLHIPWAATVRRQLSPARFIKLFYQSPELRQRLSNLRWELTVRAAAHYFLYGFGAPDDGRE